MRHRRTGDRQRQSVEALALSLPRRAFRTVSWREGSNAPLSGRFAALRVRAAQGDRLRQEEWLLIECPKAKTSQRDTSYPICRQARDERNWSVRSRRAGGSNAIIRTSSRSSAWITTKDVVGGGFIITPRSALLLTVFWLPNAWVGRIKKNRPNAGNLPCPRMTARAGRPMRAQRHVVDSIATLRWTIAVEIAVRLLRKMSPHLRI